ncbi:Membrane magnesium transporter [Linum grandiflorum]
MGLGFTVGVIGVVILGHAAYSTSQYRGLLKIVEEEFSGPTMDVVLEVVLGLLLCMWAALAVPGKFISVHPHSDENRVVSLPEKADFMIFNHRGRIFASDIDLRLRH